MIGIYAAVLAVCLASLAIGQAAIALCGVRRWSWLAPTVGLALLCAICWGTVRLPAHGVVPAILVPALAIGAALYLRRRVEGWAAALRVGWPIALLALAATALPFVAEGHFGILGTSFNPDMSQHLLAADRLAHGHGSQLLHQGYPLGPHAIAVALHKGLGINLVQAFSGLTIAISVLATLTTLTVFAEHTPALRIPASLVVGLTYMTASYFAQGAFKETLQALLFMAFVLSLRETSSNPTWRSLPLRFVPAALLAVGSVYTYSFPGLLWLFGAAVLWAVAEFAVSRCLPSAGGAVGGTTPEDALATGRGGGSPAATGPAAVRHEPSPVNATSPATVRPVLWASLVFAIFVAPELSRMIDFHSFETFDPNGPGLGNLFGQISPFEALGIWPSGDFRLSPGDGAVPALGYFLGAAFAAILLGYGLVVCLRRRETALVSGLAAAALAYAAARIGGTPYTAAKAIEIGAPLAALVIVLPLLRRPVAWLYLLAAGACSLLALANAPVGPVSYSPALTGLRGDVGEGPTLVLASRQLLADEHGTPYISWELRGGRVCIQPADESSLPTGVRYVVAEGNVRRPPFPGLRLQRVSGPYTLWRQPGKIAPHSPCPLIAVRQARQGSPR